MPHAVLQFLSGVMEDGRRYLRPRFILITIGVVFAVISLSTFREPPVYLHWPDVYAGAAAAGAIAVLVCILRPGKLTTSTCGAITIASAGARSAALAVEFILHTNPSVSRYGYLVSTLSWGLIAVLIHAVFLVVIVPWSATGSQADAVLPRPLTDHETDAGRRELPGDPP